MNRSSIKRRRRSKRKSIKRGGAGEGRHKKEVENFFKGMSSPLVRTTVEVEVPAGLGSGDTLTLEVEEGVQVDVEIPAGVSAGDEFEVEITEKLKVTGRIGETIGRFLKEKNNREDYPNFCALIYRICCSIFGIIRDIRNNNMKTKTYHYAWWLWPLSFGELPNSSEEGHTGEHNKVWYTPSFLKGSEFDVFKSTSKGGGLPIEGGMNKLVALVGDGVSAVRSLIDPAASAQGPSSSSHEPVKQRQEKVNQFMVSTNVGEVTAQQELKAAGWDLERALEEYNRAPSVVGLVYTNAAAKAHPKKSGNFIISGFNQETYKIFRDRFPELYQQWLHAHQLLFENMDVVSLEDKYPQVDDERVVQFNVSTLPNFPELQKTYTEEFCAELRALRKQRKPFPKTPAAAPAPAPAPQLPPGWTKFEHEGVVWYYPTLSGPKAGNLQREFPGTPRQRVPRIMTASAGVGVVNEVNGEGGNQCYIISLLQCISSLPYFKKLSQRPFGADKEAVLAAVAAHPQHLTAYDVQRLTLSECFLMFTKQKYKRDKPFPIKVPRHSPSGDFVPGERSLVGIIKEKVGEVHLGEAPFGHNTQEDAAEFWGLLSEGMENDGSIPLESFTVYNKKRSICLNCIKKERESISYTRDIEGARAMLPLVIANTGVRSVQGALTDYYRESTRDNEWFCPSCRRDTKRIDKQILTRPLTEADLAKGKADVEREIELSKARGATTESMEAQLARYQKTPEANNPRRRGTEKQFPEYLILQLNRFSSLPPAYKQKKDETPIKMNKYVYLYPYSDRRKEKQYRYELRCVCFQSGWISIGHYKAKCLEDDGNWYFYNDHRVRRCTSPADSSHKDCYILFYKRDGEGSGAEVQEELNRIQEESERLLKRITTGERERELLRDAKDQTTFTDVMLQLMKPQAAPEPGTGPKGKEATMRKFTLLVSTEDQSLFVDRQRKANVNASSTDQLNSAVEQRLGLPVAVQVLIFDDDFEEWVAPKDLEEVPTKAKVMIERK